MVRIRFPPAVSLRTIYAWSLNIESQWEHYKRQLAQNSPVETTHITETLGSTLCIIMATMAGSSPGRCLRKTIGAAQAVFFSGCWGQYDRRL